MVELGGVLTNVPMPYISLKWYK